MRSFSPYCAGAGGFVILLLAGSVNAEDIPVRDFVSLGIYAQTVREYYLFPESAGDLWYDSTRFALQWMSNALFDCGGAEEIENHIEELRKLLLSTKRAQTLDAYFDLDHSISELACADSLAYAAFECGTYLGQLRFYLPRFMAEEDQVRRELYRRLAEEPCAAMKKKYLSWDAMIDEYYSRTSGNPLKEFMGYLNDTRDLPVENSSEDLKKELVTVLEDAARIIADF